MMYIRNFRWENSELRWKRKIFALSTIHNTFLQLQFLIFKILKSKKEGIDLCKSYCFCIFLGRSIQIFLNASKMQSYICVSKWTNYHTAIIVMTGRTCCIKTTNHTYIRLKYKYFVVVGLPNTSLQHLNFQNFNVSLTIAYIIWKIL